MKELKELKRYHNQKLSRTVTDGDVHGRAGHALVLEQLAGALVGVHVPGEHHVHLRERGNKENENENKEEEK